MVEPLQAETLTTPPIADPMLTAHIMRIANGAWRNRWLHKPPATLMAKPSGGAIRITGGYSENIEYKSIMMNTFAATVVRSTSDI